MPDFSSQLTVVEKVYHRALNEDPSEVRITFTRQLKTQEQPLLGRKQSLSEEWSPLEIGWFDNLSGEMVMLENPKARFNTNPSPDALKEFEQKVVEVSYTKDPEQAWLIYPGEALRAYASRLDKLWVRCRLGTTVLRVNVFPV